MQVDFNPYIGSSKQSPYPAVDPRLAFDAIPLLPDPQFWRMQAETTLVIYSESLFRRLHHYTLPTQLHVRCRPREDLKVLYSMLPRRYRSSTQRDSDVFTQKLNHAFGAAICGFRSRY